MPRPALEGEIRRAPAAARQDQAISTVTADVASAAVNYVAHNHNVLQRAQWLRRCGSGSNGAEVQADAARPLPPRTNSPSASELPRPLFGQRPSLASIASSTSSYSAPVKSALPHPPTPGHGMLVPTVPIRKPEWQPTSATSGAQSDNRSRQQSFYEIVDELVQEYERVVYDYQERAVRHKNNSVSLRGSCSSSQPPLLRPHCKCCDHREVDSTCSSPVAAWEMAVPKAPEAAEPPMVAECSIVPELPGNVRSKSRNLGPTLTTTSSAWTVSSSVWSEEHSNSECDGRNLSAEPSVLLEVAGQLNGEPAENSQSIRDSMMDSHSNRDSDPNRDSEHPVDFDSPRAEEVEKALLVAQKNARRDRDRQRTFRASQFRRSESELHEKLELLAMWKPGARKKRLHQVKAVDMPQVSIMEDIDMQPNPCPHFVMHPTSHRCISWDMFAICVLIRDLIAIPLGAYGLPESRLLHTLEVLAAIVWTMDIVISFFKGYSVKGYVEMRPAYVMIHYMRTWFLFDVAITLADWLFLMEKMASLEKQLWIVGLCRGVRLLRVARIAKHGSRFVLIFTFIRSENWRILIRIFWMLIALLFINHFLACGFYAIGKIDGFDRHWIDAAFVYDNSFAYRYTTSLHWSVTQLSPASMEVVPVNALERTYNVLAIFIGLLLFSWLVSSMTNSMTYLTELNHEKARQREELRRYIVSKDLSLKLGNDIMNHVGAMSKYKRRATAEDIVALKGIPKKLLERLYVEVHTHALLAHPLFAQIKVLEPEPFNTLCYTAVKERSCELGEEIFRIGRTCAHMWFCVSGAFHYVPGYGADAVFATVQKPQWVSEAAMWVKWETRGRLNASAVSSELAEVDIKEAQELLVNSSNFVSVREYARMWIEAVQEDVGDDLLTDVWGTRPQITRLVNRSFGVAEEESAAQRLMMLWGIASLDEKKVFMLWKKVHYREKMRRKQGILGMVMSWFSRNKISLPAHLPAGLGRPHCEVNFV